MVIKPIPAPVQEIDTLDKVKKSFFTPKPKPIRKVVIVQPEITPPPQEVVEPIVTDDSVHFPTIEELDLDLKPQTPTKPHFGFNKKKLCIYIFECAIGGFLTIFGATNLFNTTMKLLGTGAEFLFVYQLGTISIVCGIVIIYDGIKRAATL